MTEDLRKFKRELFELLNNYNASISACDNGDGTYEFCFHVNDKDDTHYSDNIEDSEYFNSDSCDFNANSCIFDDYETQ